MYVDTSALFYAVSILVRKCDSVVQVYNFLFFKCNCAILLLNDSMIMMTMPFNVYLSVTIDNRL